MRREWSAATIVVFALMACASRAAALDIPDVIYPALPQRAASAAAFVPAGWRLEKLRSGDLNKDAVPDVVMLLRQDDAKNILSNPDGMGRNPLDTNPRILAVAFGDKSGGFSLSLQNHTLIRRSDDPVMSDVMDEDGDVVIRNGALRVSLHLFMSAGGWGMSSTHLTFRHQNGRFELIGFDRDETQRNSGQTMNTSVNYSTGRMSRTAGSIENDKTRVTRSALPKRPLKTIEEVGDGLDFDPLK